MKIDEMEKQLSRLKIKKQKLESEILALENKIKESKNNVFSNVKLDKNNPSLFEYYMLENRSRKNNTTAHYFQTLEAMKKILEEEYSISFEYEFYYVDDPIAFSKIIDLFERSADLMYIIHISSPILNIY